MSKPNKAELIYVNSILQGCIQEWLDNPPVTTYDALNAAFRRKFDQLEKDTQKLLAPPRPRKPVSRVQETERTGTVVPVPDGLKFDTDNAKLKRRRRDE